MELLADVNANITSKPNNGFDGEFNGNGHTITVNINFDSTASGLFRNIFENANFHDVNLAGTVTSRTYMSPLCVYNNGLVKNVNSSVTINVPTYGYAGGILFRNNPNGKIENCKFTGSVTSHARAAGIACENQGIISSCINEGAISSTTDNFVGGIVAVAGTGTTKNDDPKGITNSITSCINKGNITSADHDCGGVVGFAYSNTKITYCSNYGKVVSTGATSGRADGGVVGRINGDASSISNAQTVVNYCYNGGEVESNLNLGGLIGMINRSTNPVVSIVGGFSTGKVSGTASTNTGTLIGWVNSNTISLSDTWTVGKLSGSGSTAKNGIGGGTASGTSTSKADGVSDDFRAIIKAIREYNCVAIPGFSTLYGGLDDGEKTLLNQINYYDDLNTYAMKTYGQAAEYIIDDQAHGARVSLLNLNNNYWAVIIVISVMVLSTASMVFVIRRKKHAASK